MRRNLEKGGEDSNMKIYADRSDRGKLRFTGPQRAWFLHQIMTNAFDPIAPGEVREAALLTPHGRMVGYIEAVATEDAILAHFEPELIQTLPDAIRRYVFATEVDITDVTDEMGLVLVAGDLEELDVAAAVQSTHALGVDAVYEWVEEGSCLRWSPASKPPGTGRRRNRSSKRSGSATASLGGDEK
jgi:folate-binding Fe-S cluster repair protein YgfZ